MHYLMKRNAETKYAINENINNIDPKDDTFSGNTVTWIVNITPIILII